MIHVHVTGNFGHRQPLAYAPIHALVKGVVTLQEDLARADLVVVAHPKDLVSHGARLKAQMGTGQRLVLLSEEPFWDTIWGGDPFLRAQTHTTAPNEDTDQGPLPYTWLNAFTSPIYTFAKIPYFPLTDRRYFNRYALRFERNARRSPADWHAHFSQMTRIAFVAEKRRDTKFDRRFEGRDVFGLSALRTRIAQTCQGDVVRRGRGWTPGARRQELSDWHLDKLLELDGAVRVLSAIENTHARHYITEKIFDSFAVGAWPLYIAGPDHRMHDLCVPDSWLNLYGHSPETAAAAIADLRPDAHAYAAAQTRLSRLFSADNLAQEYARLGHALTSELETIANS